MKRRPSPFGFRSPFGRTQGGATLVLTAFVDNLDQSLPAFSVTSSQAGTLYIDLDTSDTPPTYNTGDVDTLTEAITAGSNPLTLDFSAYAGQTFYVHIRLLYDTDRLSNVFTSQEITVPAAGGNLITNGTFDTDLTGWTTGPNLSSVAASGRAEITRSGSITSNDAFRQIVTTPIGNLRLQFTFSNGVCAVQVFDGGGGTISGVSVPGASPASYDFANSTTETRINFWTGDGETLYLDNVTLEQI